MRTALSIAGSDSSGGAGIQADLKTMTLNGVFAMSAVTALTAQNTTGVTGIMEVTPEFLQKQIDAVFEDIRPDAVKIGMVSSAGLIEIIADRLKAYKAEQIVLDPVMVATSGSRLIEEEAVATLEKRLLPLASVTTPNIPEAEILSRGFNKMLSHIRELIGDIRREEQEKNAIEIKMLQAQINPHFLYNILNVIRWKAVMHGEETISSMLLSLIRLLEFSGKKTGTFVTI